MSATAAGILTIVVLAGALVAAYRPFGDFLYRVVSGTKHARVETPGGGLTMILTLPATISSAATSSAATSSAATSTAATAS